MTAHSTSTKSARLPALACGGFPPTQGDEAMTAIETLDRPPAGWFVLDVMRAKSRSPDTVDGKRVA
jgi:hypothetical protein